MADFRVIRVPESLGNGLAERTGTDFVDVVLGTTSQVIYHERFAGRSADGTTSSFGRGATLTRTAQGRWTVVFSGAHTDGANYHPSLTTEEAAAVRPGPHIAVVGGSQTANGFDVQITVGDNGGANGVYTDFPWSFGVDDKTTVITSVAAA